MSTYGTEDVTAVFDDKYNQVFELARPMRASVRPSAHLMDHPLESGAVMTDHRVFDPLEIELLMMIGGEEYTETYIRIKDYFRGNSLLTVQTDVDVYPNMAIELMPFEKTPERADVLFMQLRLREVLLVTAQFEALPPRAVAKDQDASTKKRGEQDATESKKSSRLNNLFGGSL